MEKVERQENLEEIKRFVEKQMKNEKKLSTEEMNKILMEANENVNFLNTLDEVDVKTTGKRVIFVDGKACLVYDNGVFYIEDSMDSRKSKKKLTRKQATELYVEYFFRYIMNPAIERKKMSERVKKVAVKARPAKERLNKKEKVVKSKENNIQEKEEKKQKSPVAKTINKSEGYVR